VPFLLQPPGIRHRVLEAGGGLEVVEIAVPAAHETFADPQCALPNSAAPVTPGREFFLDDGTAPGGRQRFVYFSADASTDFEMRAAGARRTLVGGVDETDTGIAAATAGYAAVRVLTLPEEGAAARTPFAPTAAGLQFLFATQGSAEVTLQSTGGAPQVVHLEECDALAVAPGTTYSVLLGKVGTAVLDVSIPVC